MHSIKSSFFTETSSFVNNHKLLCALTLGLAVALYAIGNLAGRAVSWISECCGTTKKTDSIGREVLNQQRSVNQQHSVKTEHAAHEIQSKTATDLSSTASKLLTAFNSPQYGWVMVPPKDQLKVEKPFTVGSGAIGFSGNGRWKIHLSIDPTQMEQAIPIIVSVLHSEHAPRLGFKMQTKVNLLDVHQIGKEFAIIFDKQVEEACLKGNYEPVQNCLSLLWKQLNSAGIRPEPGFVLTPQTMKDIEKAPNDTQVKEKENLQTGKFDREIRCPGRLKFFHYRDENFAPMRDADIGDLRGYPGVFATSDILKLAREQPDLAHNPTRSPDPFLNLRI
jgi:hypothetical protein